MFRVWASALTLAHTLMYVGLSNGSGCQKGGRVGHRSCILRAASARKLTKTLAPCGVFRRGRSSSLDRVTPPVATSLLAARAYSPPGRYSMAM
jgi:hypothetical protein